MPRTQPLSTLFPYTTLFRSREALTVAFCSPPPRPSTTAFIGSGMGDALSPVRLWRPRGDLNLDVLPRRLVVEHRTAGGRDDADNNADDGSRDNHHQRFAAADVAVAVAVVFCPMFHRARG